MPIVTEDSSEGFLRRTILLDRVSSPSGVYELYGEPAYYRYVNMGDNWRVSIVAFGDNVEFQAAHRTELKLSGVHPTLRQLLNSIEEEFGSEYLPKLPGPKAITSGLEIVEDVIEPNVGNIKFSPFFQTFGRGHRV